MRDFIIDTNVLLVASAQHPDSPFDDSDVLAEHKRVVLDWLIAFRTDRLRRVVFDGLWKIWDEYHRKMTGQDIGLLIITEKLQHSLLRCVDIDYDEDGNGCLPPELEQIIHDRSDRKFVATALIDISAGGESTIINAVDTDWCDWEKSLKRRGIAVMHLIDGLCQDKRRSGTKR